MEKAQRRSGGDLFIVDNSLSHWTGLDHLREWTDLARSFDVATGFFEIGSLLALDGSGSNSPHASASRLLRNCWRVPPSPCPNRLGLHPGRRAPPHA